MNNTVFLLENISLFYTPQQPALKNISFTVEQGEIFSVIGANGSGKSTLMHILGGLLFPASGQLSFNGHRLTEKALQDDAFNRYFRQCVGYVFQQSEVQLFCPTVMDELLFGPLQVEINKDEAIARANDVMNLLNINHLRNRPPYLLSGGEKKRVAVASILTMNPDVLLMDEPTAGLDPRTESLICELIFKLQDAGKTIILSSHDLGIVSLFDSRLAILSEDHTLARTGESNEILRDIDFLVSVNLISEHVHRHNHTLHKHLFMPFAYHKHPRSSAND